MDHVDEWSLLAADWSRYWAPAARPTQLAIIEAAGVGAGTTVLDAGSGSGEFLATLREAGATVAGCDPAEGMIDIARTLVPDADLRVASAERLPWPDDAFDLVTAVNALAFTDADVALAEFARVGRRVAVANWAEDDLNDLTVIERALAGDAFEPSGEGREAGYLTRLLQRHNFTVDSEGIADAPMAFADGDDLVRAMTFGEDDDVRAELAPTVLDAAAAFKQDDGGYLLRNSFRWAVGEPR